MGKKQNIESDEIRGVLTKIYNIISQNEEIKGHEPDFAIKSLWLFRHVPQIHSLMSWGYLAAKSKVVKKAYKSLQTQIEGQIIPENLGSIGMAFGDKKYHEDWLYIENTYNAKEGTIIEIDLKLRHRSVLFVPFMDNKKSVIAILLLSIKGMKNKKFIQKKIKKGLKVSGINDLVQLAYRNERNKDVIKNVKEAKMKMDSIDNETLLEKFVRSSFIEPILEFNQGTSFVPIIEIEDKQHLQESQWGYSSVVYNKLRQRLSEQVTGKDTKEPSSVFIEDFISKCKAKGLRTFEVDIEGCKITYDIHGANDDVRDDMIKKSQVFLSKVDKIIKENNGKSDFDPKTEWTIRKKYISEKLNQKYKGRKRAPFYLVLKEAPGYFDKELITSNLETLSLDTWRKRLIDKEGSFYKFSHNYSSKTIPGLNFIVYTDKSYDIEEIFNDDVKAFIEQRCLYYKLLLEQRKAEKAAVRASIAQVMARNMSHNFGSHVLSNLIDDRVYEKVKDDTVKKDLKRYMSLDNLDAVVFKEDKDQQLPFFFQYLKSRMDYLSEVTFGVPNLLTTKMMYNDVMKELDQARILLNYISGISNFQYKIELKYNEDVLTDQNDIGVAFPSDVLGCQAFYNIIENIIRNTAKHAKNKNGETVTFTITIKDNFAEESGCKDVEGVDELYCVEIDNGVLVDNIDVLVNGERDKDGEIIKKGQNTRLNESVLEGQNLRSSSLGLLEMEASAAFLRQIDLPEIESDDYTVDYDEKYYHIDSKGKKRLNILKAFAIKEKEDDSSGYLGYRLFLQKPKEFLLVGEWGVTDEKKKQLLNCGIQFIKEKKFCHAMEAEKAFAHQFLIYQEGVSGQVEEYLADENDCSTLLPLRKLSIKDKQEIEGFWKGGEKNPVDGKQVLQSLKEWAWNRYFNENVQKELHNNTQIQITTEFDNFGEVNNQVVFLNHGDKKNHSRYVSDSTRVTSEVWVENLLSRTWGKLPKFNVFCQGEDKSPEALVSNYKDNLEQNEADKIQIRLEIFEAYHNKVIVIDERVQKFAKENKEGKGDMIPCEDLFKSTNVIIPDIKLDPTDFGDNTKTVEEFLEKNIPNAFLLIHYGILERMYNGKTETIKEELDAWVKKAKRVVVTSGRGAHSLDLPKSVCFVNLSSMLYAFCENRNKYIINNLLNQSRRKRNEQNKDFGVYQQK